MADTPPVYVGHGHRGTVSMRTEPSGLRVATKRRLPGAPKRCIAHEADCLELVNKWNIGPRLLGRSADGESFSYEYVEGRPILEHCQGAETSREEVLEIFEKVFQQLVALDRMRLNKHELTWPAQHILVSGGGRQLRKVQGLQVTGGDDAGRMCSCRVVLIDFERCTPSAAKPKNVTQFLQFLATPTVRGLLLAKGIVVDVPALRAFGSSYRAQSSAMAAAGTEISGDLAAANDGEWGDMVGRLGLRREVSSAERQEHARQLAVAAEVEASKSRRQQSHGGRRRSARGSPTAKANGEASCGAAVPRVGGSEEEGVEVLSGRAARRLAVKRARDAAAAPAAGAEVDDRRLMC